MKNKYRIEETTAWISNINYTAEEKAKKIIADHDRHISMNDWAWSGVVLLAVIIVIGYYSLNPKIKEVEVCFPHDRTEEYNQLIQTTIDSVTDDICRTIGALPIPVSEKEDIERVIKHQVK